MTTTSKTSKGRKFTWLVVSLVLGSLAIAAIFLCVVLLCYRYKYSRKKTALGIANSLKWLNDELLASMSLEGFDRRFLVNFNSLQVQGELGKGDTKRSNSLQGNMV